jgi:uncharacterized membrane protein SpoIIM required for sporulation
MEQLYGRGQANRLTQPTRFEFTDPQFPADFRKLTHWLAIARRRHYPSGVITRLERMVMAGHQSYYRRGSGGMHFIDFFLRGFPQVVRRNGPLVLLAAVLFFGPLIGIPFLVQHFPAIPYYFADAETLDSVAETYRNFETDVQKRGSEHDVLMWGFYFFNNISIDLRCFAWGGIFGIGAAFLLLFNGVALGSITGHVIAMGASWNFFTFTCTHGAPELIGAVLSGAAGMRIGFSLLAPGCWSRGQAFRDAAKEALLMLFGAACLTLCAAFIEAFWSPNPQIPPWTKFAAAGVLWTVIPAYLLFAGRRELSL